jgi:hypothetical protein
MTLLIDGTAAAKIYYAHCLSNEFSLYLIPHSKFSKKGELIQNAFSKNHKYVFFTVPVMKL